MDDDQLSHGYLAIVAMFWLRQCSALSESSHGWPTIQCLVNLLN